MVHLILLQVRLVISVILTIPTSLCFGTTLHAETITSGSEYPNPNILCSISSCNRIVTDTSTSITVSVTMDPGDHFGKMADWWLVVRTPSGFVSWVYPAGWESGIHVAAQTKLFDLKSPLTIFEGILSEGTYRIYFAVDENADGNPDASWLDSMDIVVLNSISSLETIDSSALGSRRPLILVHGNNSEVRTRYRWSDFINKASENSTFIKKYKIYLFKWDSELSNAENGAALGASIDREAALADEKIMLMAHSRGGLVSRYYMNNYLTAEGLYSCQLGGDRVEYLLTLATPHRGSPGADRVWTIFSFDYNYWNDQALSLSKMYLNQMWDSSFLYLLWDDVDKELTNEEVCWSPALLEGKSFCSKLDSSQTDLASLNKNTTYLKKIIAYGGNEYNGDVYSADRLIGLDSVISVSSLYEHMALSYFSGLMAEMPIIPNGYPDEPIDDDYLPFQANDGMVPLTSALMLKPESGDVFHIKEGELDYDKTQLKDKCQIGECHVIDGRQTDHLDFLDDPSLIEQFISKLNTL